MSIIPFFFIAAIIVLIFVLFSVKNTSGMSEEDMIKNVYIYLVLFVTMMMVIGGSVGAFMALADIISPTPYYTSYEDYKMRYLDKSQDGLTTYSLTEQEMSENYEEMIKTEVVRQENRAKNSLIKSFGWIVVPFPVFLFFQRKLNKN